MEEWRTRVGKLRAGGREGDRMDPAGAHLECTADTESRRQRQRMHRRMHTHTRAACCEKWEWYDGDEISVMCGAKSGVIRSRILITSYPPTHPKICQPLSPDKLHLFPILPVHRRRLVDPSDGRGEDADVSIAPPALYRSVL